MQFPNKSTLLTNDHFDSLESVRTFMERQCRDEFGLGCDSIFTTIHNVAMLELVFKCHECDCRVVYQLNEDILVLSDYNVEHNHRIMQKALQDVKTLV